MDGGAVRRTLDRRPVPTDEALALALQPLVDLNRRAGRADPPVLIDAARDVPWRDVVAIIDFCKLRGFHDVQFAAPDDWR